MADAAGHFSWRDALAPLRRDYQRAPEPGEGKARPPHRRLKIAGAIFLLLVAAIVLFLLLFQWDWLRGPLAHYISAKTGREVRIEGHLRVHPFSWTPQATVGGLKIGNPKWLGRGETFQAKAITVRVKLLPLLALRTEVPLLRLDEPEFNLVRDAQGRISWQFKKSSKPAKLPPIQNFIINDGRLRYRDVPRKITVDGTIQSHENIQGGAGAAFQLVGHGSINTEPFLMRVTGGPLINVRKDRPYRFDADVRAGGTHIAVQGAFPKPFDFGMIDAHASASGPDLADIYSLSGVPLPNTPPYSLTANVSRRGQLFSFERMTGRVGSSDLAGSLSVDGSSGRPMLKANLTSRSLLMDDLTAVFGGKKAGPTPLTSRGRVVRTGGGGRLLPNATLDPQRIRGLDADVHYRALSIRAVPGLPLRAVTLRMILDHGLLVANPLSFQFPQGQVSGSIRLNARTATPVTDLDMRVSGLRLEHFVKPIQGSIPITGTLLGRAKLHGTGNSIYKATASSSGSMTFVVPGGEMRKTFANLMGVNVLPGVLGLISKNQDRTQLRCAVAHFEVTNGVMRTQQFIADTDPVRIEGHGSISLVDESMNLQIKGKPKKFQILHLNAPIDITGRITQPHMHVETGKAIAQGGIAVAIGALVSPLAAILPFVDGGLAKNADCSALTAQAGQGPAAVTPVRRGRH